MGGKYKFSAQDRDLEYFIGEVNILPYLLTFKATFSMNYSFWYDLHFCAASYASQKKERWEKKTY